MVAYYDAFISYSRFDNKNSRISQLVDDLRAAFEETTGRSLRVFFDKAAIDVADMWEKKLLDALENSRLLIAMVSPSFLDSPWCLRELHEFLQFERSSHGFDPTQVDSGLVIPVKYVEWEESGVVEDEPPDKVTLLMRQWADFDGLEPGSASYLAAVQALVARLTKLLGPSIGENTLTRIPVCEALDIAEVTYGEGGHIESVPVNRLTHVDLYSTLEKEFVAFDGTFQYLPRRLIDNGVVKFSQFTKVPRNIVVRGARTQRGSVIAIYVCVGIHYFQNFDSSRTSDTYEVECTIGRGGIADFVDTAGRFQNWNPLIYGDGLGTVCGVVVVELDGRAPVRRSRHALLIRSGIRYPEDVWISTHTRAPITSHTGDLSAARFIFQSRQPNGQSCDVFAADFSGGGMVNLTWKNMDAYDGFFDDSGTEVARWIDPETVQYCSMSDGRRVIRQVRDRR
ncbi:toll/interleukin-1 receptor domain-containing protein [Nocardia amamiensis]|uniref:Toll/interleukin-1 receptor domain-containing protein n=1 Tax=Nocardia amamiensis TaxID=404578 RepID=A0ABS0CWA8_9NOCA|nr:toll/interleukin-1 receptor domain-containing protein [Nocardia amamiensis]MBF6300893.1 toll/interleukin-1 receptor domain-containing protein [Nocardia amamiensis]